jgi:hypothetical protein
VSKTRQNCPEIILNDMVPFASILVGGGDGIFGTVEQANRSVVSENIMATYFILMTLFLSVLM